MDHLLVNTFKGSTTAANSPKKGKYAHGFVVSLVISKPNAKSVFASLFRLLDGNAFICIYS